MAGIIQEPPTYDDFEVEQEDELETAPLTEPFDPRKIDITPESQNVQYLVELLEDEHVDLNTEFQRSPDLWPPTKKSRFIESLLIRLPIPPFYFAAPEVLPPDRDHPFQVVDGLQRLSALKHFVVDGALALSGLSFLKDLEGKTYAKLKKSFQRAIMRAQVTVYTIRPDTPDRVKYVLFERVNTGGLTLNPQEIRHALNQGIPAQYLKELVDLPVFSEVVRLKDGRMKDRELALRYLAFRMTPPERYQRPLKRFLDCKMERLAETAPSQRSKWKREFDESLQLARDLLGHIGFSKQTYRPQFNKALFEAWTVCLSGLDVDARQRLLDRRDGLLAAYLQELNDSASPLTVAVTLRTSDETAVTTRFNEIRKLIEKTLERP